MSSERPQDLDEVKLWIAEHDGRINAYWETQHTWNERVDSRHQDLYSRISALEKKVMWVAGAAAVLGSLLGTLIPKIIA